PRPTERPKESQTACGPKIGSLLLTRIRGQPILQPRRPLSSRPDECLGRGCRRKRLPHVSSRRNSKFLHRQASSAILSGPCLPTTRRRHDEAVASEVEVAHRSRRSTMLVHLQKPRFISGGFFYALTVLGGLHGHSTV